MLVPKLLYSQEYAKSSLSDPQLCQRCRSSKTLHMITQLFILFPLNDKTPRDSRIICGAGSFPEMSFIYSFTRTVPRVHVALFTDH